MSKCSIWFPRSGSNRATWGLSRFSRSENGTVPFPNRQRILLRVVSKATLFAMIFALTWPPSLIAAADATSLLVLTSVIGQRSVLDRDEEQQPPPEQPAEAEPEEKEEVVAPAETEQLPEPAEEEIEAEQPPAETEEEEEPEEQKRKPPAEPPRRPRARGTASLDTPAEEQAPKEEASRKADVHDVLYWRVDRDEIREMPVVLCPEYLPIPLPPERLAEEFEFQRWTTSGTATHSIQGTQIVRISYYENRVGTQAARELGLPSFELLTEPGRVVDLSERPQSYDEAEKLLRNALAEHDSAVQRRLRKGTIWKEKLREPLVQALVNLELGRVDQLIGQQLYQQAQAECERLAGEFGDAATQSAELRRRYDQILEARAERALGQDDYATVRELLDQMATRFDGQLGGAGARFRSGSSTRQASWSARHNSSARPSPSRHSSGSTRPPGSGPPCPGSTTSAGASSATTPSSTARIPSSPAASPRWRPACPWNAMPSR